eukprot:scaffold52815_cov32-Cyclotella_meneghiniana.AAC.1
MDVDDGRGNSEPTQRRHEPLPLPLPILKNLYPAVKGVFESLGYELSGTYVLACQHIKSCKELGGRRARGLGGSGPLAHISISVSVKGRRCELLELGASDMISQGARASASLVQARV